MYIHIAYMYVHTFMYKFCSSIDRVSSQILIFYLHPPGLHLQNMYIPLPPPTFPAFFFKQIGLISVFKMRNHHPSVRPTSVLVTNYVMPVINHNENALCSIYMYVNRLGNLKDSAFFRSVSGVFPASFRKKAETFSGKRAESLKF